MTTEANDIAQAALSALDERRQIAPFGLSLSSAYAAAAVARDARIAQGAKIVGRKIGFTNRTVWGEHGLHEPIWGYVYDRTSHSFDEPVRAADFLEGRIEPEIVFGLADAIGPEMSVAEIAKRVAWVAHGFEIVQSIYPGWKFAPADGVAGLGLHGGLWMGARRPLRSEDLGQLETFEIELLRNGEVVDRGRAANVLDGPLSALHHLARVLRDDPDHPPLSAGEVVTTGTLTRAFPIAAGEVWTTRLSGVELESARLTVV